MASEISDFLRLPFKAVKRFKRDKEYRKKHNLSSRQIRIEDIGRDLTLSTAILTTVVSVGISLLLISIKKK